MAASVSGLFVYPVKSCRGIAVDSSALTERGLLHDRQWMIVRPGVGSDPARFVTQREFPRLALVDTGLTDRSLRLSAPGSSGVEVPFDRRGEPTRAIVWRDTVSAFDQGDDVARWLSAYVGADLRLVRFDPDYRRFCNRAYAGDSGAHTGFADGYPVLVIGSASLADLNDRLLSRGSDPLPMDRFRPNLVVDGLEPYDEDHLASIDIGGVRLRVVKPCVRCGITTTDQQTAEVGEEPLLTMAGYRMNTDLDGLTFGMNAIVEAGAGETVTRGAAVLVDWNF